MGGSMIVVAERSALSKKFSSADATLKAKPH